MIIYSVKQNLRELLQQHRHFRHGVVKSLNVEPQPGQVEASGADAMLRAI